MKVLCYVRPWFKEYVSDVCEAAFPASDIDYVSDFKGIGTVDLPRVFYSFYESLKKGQSYNIELDDATLTEVCLRCRLLRSIPKEEALRLCYAMWLAWEDILKNTQPDYVLSITVDSYVLDLLSIACSRKKIKFIGYVKSFINNYFRLTVKGEYIKLREPQGDEVLAVLDTLLQDSYLPDFVTLNSSAWQERKTYCLNQIKSILRYLYFFLKRRLTKDYLCYHYWASELGSRENIMKKIKFPQWDNGWRKIIRETSNLKKVFIPLQYTPEATVDYWCPNINIINYHSILLEAVKIFSDKGYMVIIKEHPACVGMRNIEVYEALKNNKNVLIIPPGISSNYIINMVDCVFVWTGTVGFEAVLRGIPVIHLGVPFYISGQRFVYAQKIEDLFDILDDNLFSNISPITRMEQIQLVQHVLSGCLPGHIRYIDLRSSNRYKEEYIKEIEKTAKSFQKLG